MYKLTNVLRPYPWGSQTAIAQLLGREPSGGPEAELWLGAHPDAPSVAHTADGPVPLDALITAEPQRTLGSESRARFGDRLPFLMKLLAADKALSLQVHPSLAQARAGFAAENAAGVPRAAANRSYRDDNHKPEMIYALTRFGALCGFRAAAESAAVFAELAASVAPQPDPLLSDIAAILRGPDESKALQAAFQRLISGAADVVTALALVQQHLGAQAALTDPTLRTVSQLCTEFPGDPGALISLLLNVVELEPGECIALPAGNVHAYLHGLGVEVMASSDNVLRGGLTGKHLDVPELLRTIDFRALPVPHVEGVATGLGQQLFDPGFGEFGLQRISIEAGAGPVPLAQHGALLILLVSGSALLDSPRGDLQLHRGESAFVPDVEAPTILHSATGCLAFAVTTGAAGTGLPG